MKNWKKSCILAFRQAGFGRRLYGGLPTVGRSFWSTKRKRMFGLPAVGRFDDFSIQSTSSFIVQETHYDPWGLELTGLGFQAGGGVKVNRYLYNGKELLDDLNLNLCDHGARLFDPVIGRWISIDPMAYVREWLSPYNFVQNNPLNRIDPDGRFNWVIHKDNEVYWDEKAIFDGSTNFNPNLWNKRSTS